MAINQTTNNQLQTEDIVSRYDIQRTQNNPHSQQTQQQVRQRESAEKDNPVSEDVRVTLSRQGRAKNASRTSNTPNVETQQKTHETRDIESQRALQAYQNTMQTVLLRIQDSRLENTRQRQINRIVG
jgi:hypothetical protein